MSAMRSGTFFAAGDVVEEKERLRPAADDVVDAHGHAVDAHGVVPVHEEGKLQLGAHAVRAGDEHRLGHAGKVGAEEPAEAAQAAQHPGGVGALDVLFHQLDGR